MKATQRRDGRFQVRIPAKLSQSGKRETRYFPSKSQADKWVREFREEHREHGRQAVTAEHRHWIGYLLEHVGDLQQLPTIVEYWKRSGQTISQITVADAVKAFCGESEAEYFNRRTWSDIEERLTKFAKHFGARPLHEISVAEIESFLSRTSAGGWDRWSMHKRLRPFFKFAARRRWVAVSPMQEIPIPKTPKPGRAIYAPSDLAKMLWECEKNYPTLTAYVVLCAFCFLRRSELVKAYTSEQVLQWQDVDLGDDFLGSSEPVIHVRKEVAKSTRRRDDERWIELSQTAQEWLRPIHKGSGPCVPYSHKKFV
jgi:integrase